RSGEPGLSRAGRAMEEDSLWGIDAETLKKLGVAKRKFDHLAEGVDRGAHSAGVVICHARSALAVTLRELREKLDLSVGIDVDDSLGRRGDDLETHFLKRES